MLSGIVFDMDGLLFDTERIVQRSWNLSGAAFGYPEIGEQIYHTIGFNGARRRTYFKSMYGAGFPYEDFEEKAAQYFSDFVKRAGIPVKEGAREILTFAKAHGLKIGLATSSPADYALENLRSAGLYEYFDGCVCGDMVTNSKPDPEIYRKACSVIGVRPENAAALEDAPSGIAAASAAGLKPVMIPDLVQPDADTALRAWRIVPSLKEAIPLFLELLEE